MNPMPLQPIQDPRDATDERLDLRELFSRMLRGAAQIVGLGLIGLGVSCAAYLFSRPYFSKTTIARVTFSFPGFEHGQYPDKSKFQPDDLRSPEVIADAIAEEHLNQTQEFQGTVRGGLTIEGIIPSNVIRERDRLRAIGQILPVYVPDEYQLSLVLPTSLHLSDNQRNSLLNAIVAAYRTRFQQTYANLPLGFGNAFQTLEGADYYEYELVLTEEIQEIVSYLETQSDAAKSFRSQTTNLSFNDLLRQTQLFAQIRLDETLGLIRENGLSKNRKTAMVKMDYYLRTLEDDENKALEDEKVVENLLEKAQGHSQGYVLGVKSQAVLQRTEAPIVDQGLIDSLLANDSNNFLLHQALNAGLTLKKIQSEKAILSERRKGLESFSADENTSTGAIFVQVTKSLAELKVAYDDLIKKLRATSADFERQRYADAVIESMNPSTPSVYRGLAIAGCVGFVLGLATGGGLSLLGIYLDRKGA